MQSLSRITNFADCGASAYVYQSVEDPTEYRIGGSACRDRFCTPCTRERGQAIAANVSERLGKRPCRFITLTVSTRGLSLSDSIRKLQTSFSRLLKAKAWLAKVTGGVGFLECKVSAGTGAWHPHLHLITEGRFIPQKELSDLWHTITGDSMIVHIQFVKSHNQLLRYITTYCAKTMRASDFPTDEHLDTAVKALAGVRLARTFGSWRGFQVVASPEKGTWVAIGSLAEFLELAAEGDLEATRVLRATKHKRLISYLNNHPPRAPPERQPNASTTRTQALLFPGVYRLA